MTRGGADRQTPPGRLAPDVHVTILAGGSGTRFWPVSRRERPKQLLPLAGAVPLIRQAWDRAAALCDPDRVWVSALRGQREAIARALPALRPERFLGEPVARNTAPAIGLAALALSHVDAQAIMIAAPADHAIARPAELARALASAVQAARDGRLVTLGIAPGRPETGYGWIETGPPIGSGVREAVRFTEKPDARTAGEFLASGKYLWNSGIFVWRADAILAAIRQCAPDIGAALDRIAPALGNPGERPTIDEVFAGMTSISIDHAVMEKARNVAVIPTDPGWSDVGSWDAASELVQVASGTTGESVAPDRVLLRDASGCFVRPDPDSRRLIALVGVDDLIVVDTGDALLVCRKGASQKVGEVVKELKERGRDDLL